MKWLSAEGKKSHGHFTSYRIKAFMRHCSCSFMASDWYSCVVSICLLTCVMQRIVKGNNNCMAVTYSGTLIHSNVHFRRCQILVWPTETYFDWLTCKHRWQKWHTICVGVLKAYTHMCAHAQEHTHTPLGWKQNIHSCPAKKQLFSTILMRYCWKKLCVLF